MEKSDLIKKIESFQQANELRYDEMQTFFDACELIGQMKAQLELIKIYLEHCKIEEK